MNYTDKLTSEEVVRQFRAGWSTAAIAATNGVDIDVVNKILKERKLI